MKEMLPVRNKQLIGFLAIILIGLGGYYYLEEKSVRDALYIPVHGKTITLHINSKPLTVEVVGTTDAKQKGLSGRKLLPQDRGMLFLFSQSDFHGIWMKDMLFSIDIVWIDENLTIVSISENATPDSFPIVYKPSHTSSYILEVNAGLTREQGIKIGDTISFVDSD